MASFNSRPRVNFFDRNNVYWKTFDVNENEQRVIICFKRLGDKKDEPFLNRLCVWATSSSRDVMPGGRMSHVEIMFKNKGDWWRFSIVKATRRTNEDGSYTWEPGKVHCKLVREGFEMSRYDFYTILVSREKQEYAWNFLHSQVGAEFNSTGYMWNFVLPVSISGTRGKKDIDKQVEILKKEMSPTEDLESGKAFIDYKHIPKRKWFCSELVCTALQFLDASRFINKDASRVSPNEMYRICLEEYGFHCMNPAINLIL